MEHQKVPEAPEKDYREWDIALVWNITLQGQDMALVIPRLLMEQCPGEQVVLPLVLEEEEEKDMALKMGMAY